MCEGRAAKREDVRNAAATTSQGQCLPITATGCYAPATSILPSILTVSTAAAAGVELHATLRRDQVR